MGCNDLSPGFTPSEGESEGEGEGEAEATGERVVLVELFNAVGCALSKKANPIAEQLAEEYGTDKVILVEETGWGMYSTTETRERFSWYVPGTLHTPFIATNGLSKYISDAPLSGSGGGGSTPSPAPPEDVIQEVLDTHKLAEQKLNDLVEGPGIDIENTLTILGEYLNEQTGVESTVIDDNLLQINYVSGLISFILLQEISTVPTLGSMEIKSTPSILFSQQTTKANIVGVKKSTTHNYDLQITKDLDDVMYTGNRDVLIWAPFAAEYNTWGCEQWSCDVISEFDNRFENSNLNFNIATFDNEEADVASLKNITDYDGMVIFIIYGSKGKWIATV